MSLSDFHFVSFHTVSFALFFILVFLQSSSSSDFVAHTVAVEFSFYFLPSATNLFCLRHFSLHAKLALLTTTASAEMLFVIIDNRTRALVIKFYYNANITANKLMFFLLIIDYL